jgi:prepilin-type N-terminal cleavage/methylation domain-containing protein
VNKKGFTLIEVLVGLVILGIGLLAIAGMQVTSVRGNFFSNYLTQASYAGQDRLEFLDNLSYTSTYTPNELLAGNHNDPATIISGSGIVFNRSYTVEDVNGYKIINYSITWNDGVNRNIAFSTIRSPQ